MATATTIKTVIADDHLFFRQSFQLLIGKQYSNEIEFIGQAANGIELVNAVEKHQPQLVITDIQMPEMDGIEACRTIKKKYPHINVIACSMFTDVDYVMGMIQAGASGYLVKTSEQEEIIEAIRTVSSGKPYYCSNVSEKVFGVFVPEKEKKQDAKKILFNTQETTIMQLICRQLCTKEIAMNMNLAVRTVENYRQNILDKIGAKNMVGIALYAVMNEIVKFTELLQN